MSKGALFDLDGTIRTTKSGKVAPSHPDDQVVMPGRYDKLWALKKQGYKIIAVSNQGGVAHGILTHDQVKKCFFDLNEKLGGVFDDMLYSAAHPKSDDPRRKPNPGMIHEAAAAHKLDLSKSFMVGDMKSDEEAAKNAGIPFHHADDFFKPEQPIKAGKGAGWL